MANKTYSAKPLEVERKWYVIDAEGEILGRLATRVANILRGFLSLCVIFSISFSFLFNVHACTKKQYTPFDELSQYNFLQFVKAVCHINKKFGYNSLNRKYWEV